MEALGQLALIWATVYIAVVVAKATRLTAVLYYLAFGAVLVNFGALPAESNEFIRHLAELGIIIIMFALGFEEQTDNFIANLKKSWGVAFFGALAPFIAAYSLSYWFFGSFEIALMCGLTMTATAVSLTMVSLKSEGLARSRAATLIMTSAVIDDIASLALVAVLVPLAAGDAGFEFSALALTMGKALAFFLLIIVIGRLLLPVISSGWFSRIPVIGRGGIADLVSVSEGQHAVLTTLLLALVVGLISHAFGLHPAVGAYMAGLVLREEYFALDARERFFEETKNVIDVAAFSVIGPIFFVELGTKLEFKWDVFVSVIPYVAALTAAIIFSQVTAASLAAYYTAGMEKAQSLLVGLGMLGRAELAFVVMDIAYVQNDILSEEAFYMLMLTAFWLNVAVPVSIILWKRRFGEAET